MSTPIVYGLSKCDTCRKARKWLDRAGIAHQFVDYAAPWAPVPDDGLPRFPERIVLK